MRTAKETHTSHREHRNLLDRSLLTEALEVPEQPRGQPRGPGRVLLRRAGLVLAAGEAYSGPVSVDEVCVAAAGAAVGLLLQVAGAARMELLLLLP